VADYSVAPGEVGCYEKVLAAEVVDTVTIAGTYPAVEIVSSGEEAVYVTVDGAEPTVAGQHCFALPAGPPAVRQLKLHKREPDTVVRLVSPGSPTYSVARLLE
jgi:hypothetical protein